MVIPNRKTILAFFLLATLLMPVARADLGLDLKDGSAWDIAAGGFWADSTTSIQIESADGSIGTTITGESTLGWEDRTVAPFLSVGYKFNQRHSLQLSYWSLRRDGFKEINVDITVGDENYTAGTTIDSQFRTDIYRLTYAYNLYKSQDSSVALLAGLHITDMRFKLRALGNLGLNFETEASTVAPLPTFGVSSSTRFGENWYLSLWLQGLKLRYENVEGRLNNTSLAVTYKPHKRVYYNFGVIAFDLSVKGSDGNLAGEFIYKYNGPFVSVGIAL